jgi:hypothetical protein
MLAALLTLPCFLFNDHTSELALLASISSERHTTPKPSVLQFYPATTRRHLQLLPSSDCRTTKGFYFSWLANFKFSKNELKFGKHNSKQNFSHSFKLSLLEGHAQNEEG